MLKSEGGVGAARRWEVVLGVGWGCLCAAADVKLCLETLRQVAGTEQFAVEFKLIYIVSDQNL